MLMMHACWCLQGAADADDARLLMGLEGGLLMLVMRAF